MVDLTSRTEIDLTPPDEYQDLQIWLSRNFERVVSFAEQAPASASATGLKNQIAYDDDYIYVCIATDTWKRAALSTW